ncbi:MAG: 3-deoxy-manno-octulosonate cytidylyltransferase [Candidatus Omnitrophica bacterium]|nr:3-deoxy-manno-octulosonate cytidylyltransferase [Candidatus Omnitrophota bacterium]
MKTIGVIPARYSSTRLPGKMLAEIHGKPLIQWVWENIIKSKKLDDIIIACDDEKVLNSIKKFGGRSVMTDPSLLSGTDRVAAVVKDMDVDVVVNIQGDEPMMPSNVIDKLVDVFTDKNDVVMATAVKVLKDKNEIQNPNVVKAVLDNSKNAIYFSRSPMPYLRDQNDLPLARYYKHLGVYAYKKDFLIKYTKMEQTMLEKVEKLEQLRVVENGYKIKVIQTDFDSIGVDTLEDLERVRELLAG